MAYDKNTVYCLVYNREKIPYKCQRNRQRDNAMAETHFANKTTKQPANLNETKRVWLKKIYDCSPHEDAALKDLP